MTKIDFSKLIFCLRFFKKSISKNILHFFESMIFFFQGEKNMKKTKKILMLVSLISLALACVMLIARVCGLEAIFKKPFLNILLVLATFAIGTGISLAEINILRRNKILGWVSLGLLSLSSLMAIIIFVTPLFNDYNAFTKTTLVICLVSLLFALIVSLYTKLGKRLLPLQISTYAILSILVAMLSIEIWYTKFFDLGSVATIFGILSVAGVGLLIATLVVSNKRDDLPEQKGNVETVTISKQEYDALKAENEELKKQLAELKNNK